MPTELLTKQEATRRIPAVEFIETDEVREATIAQIQRFPDYFWTAPTTTRKQFHNQFTRDERGLWIHTLQVATALERLLDSHRVPAIDIPRMSQREADNLRAAAICHDSRKYGSGYDGSGSADDHDLQASAELERADFDPEAIDAVAEHMGPFDSYDGPVPSSPGAWLLHRADMVASDPYIVAGVYNPPAELLEAQPELPHYDEGDNTLTFGDPPQEQLSAFDGD